MMPSAAEDRDASAPQEGLPKGRRVRCEVVWGCRRGDDALLYREASTSRHDAIQEDDVGRPGPSAMPS